MFRSLRNKIVILTSVISFVILAVSFSLLYVVTIHNMSGRRSIPEDAPSYSTEINNIIEDRIDYERRKSSENLLCSFILTGILMEIIVITVSYLLAGEVIEPVKKSYESQKLFIANASHELKTPIAAIKANLEAADITDNIWIDNISYETDKMARLDGELLRLSRLDLIEKPKHKDEIDLHDFTEKMKERLSSRLDGKTLKIPTENATIFADARDLEELVEILLDNAIKYSDKSIEISYGDKYFSVTNDGATIPPEKIEHIFERFYQVDKNKDGVGLGLSIAKSLAENNSWHMSAESSDNKTTFKIAF